jgi:predicted dehydrogenase
MIRLGIIGTGNMAKAHVTKFKMIKQCLVIACSDIIPGRAKSFADKYGIPFFYEDNQKMFAEQNLDGVAIVTRDAAHASAALLAIKNGVHVLCEKPLSDKLADARRMEAAANKKKILTAVNFSYRDSPSTQKAADLVRNNKLGRIMHVEGSYLQGWLVSKIWGDWRKLDPWLWRLSKRHGSMGVLGDIGVHLYDLANFIVGDFAELSCVLGTYDKGRKKIGPYILDANDSMVTTVKFKNGALGVLHSSRWATGQTNTVSLRVYGDKGALDLNLDRPEGDKLRVCFGKDVDKNIWKAVNCPKTPNMYERFIHSLRTGTQGQTSFSEGVKIQAYLEKSFLSAWKGSTFVKV